MALSLSNPGIFWVNSGVTTPDLLPYQAFVNWYEEHHIPDWMGAKPGAIPAAWRYQSVDSSRTTPFLVTYKYNNITDLNSPEFGTVPLTHSSLPGGGPVTKFTEFQAMGGPYIETWSNGEPTDEHGPVLVSEAIEPDRTSTENFQTWYRQSYIKEVSQIAGWRRTSRFENIMGQPSNLNAAGPKNDKPRWLALHEFEAGSLEGINVTNSLLGSSEQTKKMKSGLAKIDVALFKLVRVYGNKTTTWGG